MRGRERLRVSAQWVRIVPVAGGAVELREGTNGWRRSSAKVSARKRLRADTCASKQREGFLGYFFFAAFLAGFFATFFFAAGFLATAFLAAGFLAAAFLLEAFFFAVAM